MRSRNIDAGLSNSLRLRFLLTYICWMEDCKRTICKRSEGRKKQMLMSTEHHEALQVQLKTNLQNGVAEHDHAMRIARSEHRAHSLLETRRFWQLVAVVPGAVEAWGYAYEGGTFDAIALDPIQTEKALQMRDGIPFIAWIAPEPTKCVHCGLPHAEHGNGMHPFEVSA